MKVGVFGAGLIGTFAGGLLAARGHDVRLVGRSSLLDPLRADGLVLKHGAEDVVVPPARLVLATTADALAGCDVVLVTVKCGDTADAARALAPHIGGAVVVSLQNGVRNPAVLRAHLPAARVLGGMITFNVVRAGEARFVRTTSGPIVVEDEPAHAGRALVDALRGAHLDARVDDDIQAVLWGKLLFNLNNAINALCGVPLAEELLQRGYREVYAACFAEGLAAVAAAGQRVKAPLKAPIGLVPHVLRLPGPLFRLVAKRLVSVEPGARSSMWDDLQRRRKTEIDALNGEVTALAATSGTAAPVNAGVVAAIHDAEAAAAGSPALSPHALRERLGLR